MSSAPPPAPIPWVQPAQQVQPAAIAQPAPPAYGDRLHDGFYLRMAMGGGPTVGTITQNGQSLSFNEGSLAIELAIGGSPKPGLVIGGGFFINTGLATASVSGSGTIPPGSDTASGGTFYSGNYAVNGVSVGPITTMVVGPLIDVYPNPSAGLHFQGAIGIGPIIWSKGSNPSSGLPVTEYSGVDLGIMLGAGYEWWIGRQWSMGFIARITHNSADTKPEPGNLENISTSAPALNIDAWSPALLFATTLH